MDPFGTRSWTSVQCRPRASGQRTRMRLKPAMCAAAAMKVLPVPISPTTVVPRWASRERDPAGTLIIGLKRP